MTKKTMNRKQIESGMAHSIGKVRRYNEDAIYLFESEVMRMNQESMLGLYVIADGMGGHANGDKASAWAVTAFVRDFFANIYPSLLDFETTPTDIVERMVVAVQAANHAILDAYPGSGTTFTCALIFEGKLYHAHVGDSRLLLIDKKRTVQRLTHDHSLVQMMIDLGEISEAEALTHPRRSVLLRSLGFDKNVEVDCGECDFDPDDTLLLCCDGLWSVVDEAEILKILKENQELKPAAEALTAAADDAGGPDNISCILIRRNG